MQIKNIPVEFRGKTFILFEEEVKSLFSDFEAKVLLDMPVNTMVWVDNEGHEERIKNTLINLPLMTKIKCGLKIDELVSL